MASLLAFFMRRNCVCCRVVWFYLKQISTNANICNGLSFEDESAQTGKMKKILPSHWLWGVGEFWGMLRLTASVVGDYHARYGIPVTVVDVGNKGPENLTSMSPLAVVPLLKDGDLLIYGSLAIIFYLAEKSSSSPGLGNNLEERAVVESIMYWAATTLVRDVGSKYVYPSIHKAEDALSGEANSILIDIGKREVLFHLDTLENYYLCKKNFLGGNKASFADCWVTVVLSLLELVQFDLQPWPRVKAWMTVMKSNCDYVYVSYDHEERVKMALACSQKSH